MVPFCKLIYGTTLALNTNVATTFRKQIFHSHFFPDFWSIFWHLISGLDTALEVLMTMRYINLHLTF